MVVGFFPSANEFPGDLELGAFSDSSGQSPVGRRAIELADGSMTTIPDATSPSLLEKEPGDSSGAEVISYAPLLVIDPAHAGAQFGTLVHRFFEVGLASEAVRQRISDLAATEGLSEDLIDALTNRVDGFEKWLVDQFSPTMIHRELPILALTDEGTVMNGMVDLVVETEEGCWIIDHKSDQIKDSLAAFGKYRVQLGAYSDALHKLGKKVLGVAIHWTRKGEVVLCPEKDAR